MSLHNKFGEFTFWICLMLLKLFCLNSFSVDVEQNSFEWSNQHLIHFSNNNISPFTLLGLGSMFCMPSPFELFLGLKTISHCWSFLVLPKNFFGTKSSALLHVSHSPCQHILFCSGSHNTSFQNELRWKEVDLDRSIVMILEVMPEWLCCFVFIHF